jgi:hypothetical protein
MVERPIRPLNLNIVRSFDVNLNAGGFSQSSFDTANNSTTNPLLLVLKLSVSDRLALVNLIVASL